MLVRSSRQPLAVAQRAAAAALPVRDRCFHAESSRAAQLRLAFARPSAVEYGRSGRRRTLSSSAAFYAMPREKDATQDEYEPPAPLPSDTSPSPSPPLPFTPDSAIAKPPVKTAGHKPLYRAPSTGSTANSLSSVASADRSAPVTIPSEPPSRPEPRQRKPMKMTKKAQEKFDEAKRKARELRKAIEDAEESREAAKTAGGEEAVLTPKATEKEPVKGVAQQADGQAPAVPGPRRRQPRKVPQRPVVESRPPSAEDFEALRVAPSGLPLQEEWLINRTALFYRLKLSFLRDQLFAFAHSKGLRVQTGIRRDKIIDLILEHWGWAHAPLVPAKGMETPHALSLEFTPPVVYLIVRDTAFLHSLTIRKGLSVSFSPNPLSRKRWLDSQERYKAFTLVIRGPWRQVELAKHSLDVKRSLLVQVAWSQADMLGWTPPDAVIDQVSAEGGAYVERRRDGRMYFAHYFQAQRCENAKDTLIQASVDPMALAPYRPMYILGPTDPAADGPQFAMLPHMPGGHTHLPWIMGDPAVTYRIRQTSGWAVASGLKERAHQAEDLARMTALICRGPSDPSSEDTNHLGGILAQLHRRVSAARASDVSKRETKLLFGQINIVSPQQTADPLVAPLPDEWGLAKAQEWALQNPEKIAFAPSLTQTMIHFQLPGPTLRSRRLTYVRPPPKDGTSPTAPVTKAVFTFRYASPEDSQQAEEVKPKKAWHQQLKDYLAQVENLSQSRQPEAAPDLQSGEVSSIPPLDGDKPGPQDKASFEVEIRSEAEADVMMPNRSVDVRIASSSRQTLPSSSASPDLAQFFTQLAADTLSPMSGKFPSRQVPLHTYINGERYVLHEDVEMEVIEAPVPVEKDQKDTGIRVRMVYTKDKVFPQQEKRYSEMVLEGAEITPAFWQQFASISRDVRGETAALRLDRGLFG